MGLGTGLETRRAGGSFGVRLWGGDYEVRAGEGGDEDGVSETGTEESRKNGKVETKMKVS